MKSWFVWVYLLSNSQVSLLGDVAGSVLIVDCRPHSSALGNIALGGGFESTTRYVGTTFEFQNIENIHAVRDSFNALRNLFSGRLTDVRRICTLDA